MSEMGLYVQKFLKYCKNQRRLSPDTVKAYGLDLKGFEGFLLSLETPVTDCFKITRQILQEYVDHLNETFAVKTVRRRIASLRSFYNYLEGEELVSDNPFERFHLHVREPFRIPQTMSLEEVNRILACAYGDSPTLIPSVPGSDAKNRKPKQAAVNPNSREFIWLRDIAVLELLFAGGFRVSELCRLKFEDLSPDHLAIRINGKGNKERTIYLENIEVVRALNRYLAYREAVTDGNGYLFITKFDRPLSTQAVRNLVKKYTELAGIHKNITPHVFRHSFASLLLEEGVDIKYIQDFLGHSSIATTQIYLHTTSSQKRRILSAKHPRQKLILSDIAPTAEFLIR